ncbi:RCC1 domain-containing protein, partial [Microbacterium testaceum]|uniref:RCC1 domain-containing protein n=1 Tax=Microbacterium testaceum TaxID=2033 RepID=UPI003D159D86
MVFSQVSAGMLHSLALATDGSVWAWGFGASGQIGDGGMRSSPVPARVSSPSGVVFSQVSAGGSHSLALATDGSVWAWGFGADGQVGNGDTRDAFVPTKVRMPGGVLFSQVSAGGSHSLA